MHATNATSSNRSTTRKRSTITAAAMVLALARKLHRAATADSLAASLPVLRRIIATDTLQDISLPELHRRRNMVQRKHVLRTLAVEAGFSSWETYRLALNTLAPAQLAHFDLAQSRAGYPNLWFSTRSEADEHVARHGGRALALGQQAMVVQELIPSR